MASQQVMHRSAHIKACTAEHASHSMQICLASEVCACLTVLFAVLQLIITTKEGANASDNVLPVSYPNFTSMVQKGDTIFVGRYLVTGSEDSSLYLTV